MRESRYNKYDLYIFLLIASLVAGNLFGALQVPRVLAILLFFPFLSSLHKMGGEMSGIKIWAFLFVLYSFFSCFWTPAGVTEGMIASIYNLTHVVLFLEIIYFSRWAKNPIRSIVYGFLVAFAISAVIAFWELTTDQHLSTSKVDEAIKSNTGYEVYLRYFAAVTFYNLNMYVTFLCFLLPFLFYGISSTQFKTSTRIVFVASTVVAAVLILYNGSRGGLLAFAIMAIVYFMFAVVSKKNFSIYIVLFILLFVLVIYKYGSTIMNTLMMRQAIYVNLEEETRVNIWANVMRVVNDYYWLGCGADGLASAMKENARGSITLSHNVFLEVLSEYGIVFFIVFLSFFFSLFKKARRLGDKQRKSCIYQALFAFPVVGIINSAYLTQPVLWAWMASLYVFANQSQIRLGIERQVE